MKIGRVLLTVLVLVFAAGACGGVDSSSSPETAASEDGGSNDGGTDSGSGDLPAPSSTGGFLTLGDETIPFDNARCFLEEQDAGGGGKILATGQGFGTNAAGTEVMIDFTRYDEDSRFTGDDLNVTVGDPFGDESVNYSGSLDLGSVEIDGRRVSGDGYVLRNTDINDLDDYPASFELNC